MSRNLSTYVLHILGEDIFNSQTILCNILSKPHCTLGSSKLYMALFSSLYKPNAQIQCWIKSQKQPDLISIYLSIEGLNILPLSVAAMINLQKFRFFKVHYFALLFQEVPEIWATIILVFVLLRHHFSLLQDILNG